MSWYKTTRSVSAHFLAPDDIQDDNTAWRWMCGKYTPKHMMLFYADSPQCPRCLKKMVVLCTS